MKLFFCAKPAPLIMGSPCCSLEPKRLVGAGSAYYIVTSSHTMVMVYESLVCVFNCEYGNL